MLKVAILDKNEMYLQRLHAYWSRTYGGSALMVYAFSDTEHLKKQMEQEKFDILLAGTGMEVDWESIPPQTMKVCLLPGRKDGEVDGIPALARNGNADELYLKLLALYESHVNEGKEVLPGKLILFTSAHGGCGTSSCAVGYGKYLASRGKRVLYLSLELISAQETMLDGGGEEEKSMEDLFYLCETTRKNVNHSIKALVSQDSSGLQYVVPCRNPLELQEKSGGDIRNLLTTVTEKGSFDVVIVDRGFSLDEVTNTLIHLADKIVLVAEANKLGWKKQERTMVLLEEMNRRGLCLTIKMKLLCNRAGKQPGSHGDASAGGLGRNALGSLPEWKDCDPKQVTEQMSRRAEVWQLLQEAEP